MKLIALLDGGDWADASCNHLVIPDGIDFLDKEVKAWREWYDKEYLPALKLGLPIKYYNLYEWLLQHGARDTTDDDILEYWVT